MSGAPRVRAGLTLEEFLQLPEEEPPLEYIDGRIESKESPQKKHARLEARIAQRLNQFAMPAHIGEAFTELRCTFGGTSIVPDVAFLVNDKIASDELGEVADDTPFPPDLHVEIISPGQPERAAQEKLVHSTSHGCSLGWLIHPYQKTIDVYRPGRPPERLAGDGALEGEHILRGFRLPVAEVFGWLVQRRSNPGVPPARE